MKVGYIQARRIKDIEAFQVTANVDKIAVDMLDESDKSNSEGEVFAKLLSEISAGDVIVLQGLSNLPYNDVSELCSFLGSMKEMAVEVQLIDESDGQPLLSDEGFEALSYLQGFIQQKESQKKKIGRPAKKFPDNFYEVYLEYRNKNIKADSAASKLKLNKPKFYELVRLFES
jgi:DNA invertase Pin-like site-specific DNA recombinase